MSYKVPFVNFGAQYEAHKNEYDQAIERCLSTGKLVLQEDVKEFEENLAKFLGFKHVVAVANGTDALFLVLKAKNIEKESLSVTDYTFKATHEIVAHNNNFVVRKDIDLKTRMPDESTHIPVHIEGMVAPVGVDSIVEDAAQALGAKGVGVCGTATYSFYPAKILGCFGDGGAIGTNDDELAKKLRLLRHHWQTDENEQYAYNSRLDNVQAAFLNVKLKYLPEILARREAIAMKYKALEGMVELPFYQEGRVWQDYVITTPLVKELVAYLADCGIQTLGSGMTPPHVARGTDDDLPNVKKLYKEMVRLPLNETLTDLQVDYVINKVQSFYV